MPTFLFMQPYEEKIWELAEPVAASEGMELIHAECLRMKSRWLVRIYIDKVGGVTVEDCASVSHELGDILDVHDIPPGPYSLEVSSPGLNRPLSRDRDFLKYRGNRVEIQVKQKIGGRKHFRGILVDFHEEAPEAILTVDVDGTVYHIPKTAILKAHLEESQTL